MPEGIRSASIDFDHQRHDGRPESTGIQLSVAVGRDLQRILNMRRIPSRDPQVRGAMPQAFDRASAPPEDGDPAAAQLQVGATGARFVVRRMLTAGVLALAGALGFIAGAFGPVVPKILEDPSELTRTFSAYPSLGASERLPAERGVRARGEGFVTPDARSAG